MSLSYTKHLRLHQLFDFFLMIHFYNKQKTLWSYRGSKDQFLTDFVRQQEKKHCSGQLLYRNSQKADEFIFGNFNEWKVIAPSTFQPWTIEILIQRFQNSFPALKRLNLAYLENCEQTSLKKHHHTIVLCEPWIDNTEVGYFDIDSEIAKILYWPSHRKYWPGARMELERFSKNYFQFFDTNYSIFIWLLNKHKC